MYLFVCCSVVVDSGRGEGFTITPNKVDGKVQH
jgi:hypothetical protein